MVLSEQRRQIRAELASAVAQVKRKPDHLGAVAMVEERRRQYRVMAAEEYIKTLVDSAPPLTPEQRDRLAVLLRPDTGAGA